MKFKKIIAAVMTLALTAGTFGTVMTAAAADVSDISTASDDGQQSYSINIASTGNADVKVVDFSGNQISSYKAGQNIKIVTNAHDGYKVYQIIVRYADGATRTSGGPDDPFGPTKNHTFSFGVRPSNMIITVITVPDNSTAPSPTPAPTPTWEKGDANCDGRVTAEDATAVLKHLAGIIQLSNQGCKNADMDDNDKVTAADATAILKSLVNKS